MSRRRLGLFKQGGGGGYLFDDYTNGVAGFSVRKLRSAATNTLNIERSSDSATTDLILDSSGSFTLSSLVAAGGTLGTWSGSDTVVCNTWFDQSITGHDVTDSATKPIIINSGTLVTKNSNSAISFLGGGEYFTASSLAALTKGNSFSIFIVVNNNTNFGTGTVFTTNKTNAGDDYRFSMLCDRRTSQKRNIVTYDGGYIFFNLPTANNSSNQRLLTFITNGTTASAWSDGTASDNQGGIVASYSNTDFIVGTSINNSAPLNGTIQEIIIFSDDKTSDRVAIETEINNFYSIF